MTRGKSSNRALDAAVIVARARGQVLFLRPYPGSTCDFLLITQDGIFAVCVRRARRLWACIDEILKTFEETLCQIRAADHSTGIICEFWLWSAYGTMRFFRIDDDAGLVELDRYGLILAGSDAGRSGWAGIHVNTSGNLVENQQNPESAGVVLCSQKIPGLTGPVSVSPGISDPPYIRFLRKRNAALLSGREHGARPAGDGQNTASSPVLPGSGNAGSPAP